MKKNDNILILLSLLISCFILCGISIIKYSHHKGEDITAINLSYVIDRKPTSNLLFSNIFSRVPENYKDFIHLREQDSTISLISLEINKNDDGTEHINFGLGTGVIISNSATDQSNGYNVALTAGHVLSNGKDIPSSCISRGVICLAYASNGRYLGTYELLERSASHNNGYDSDYINNDIVSIKINPSDDYNEITPNNFYKTIPGVELSDYQSKRFLAMNVIAHTTNYGASHGLSGGGIFDRDGRLIGIASSGLEYKYNKKIIPIQKQSGYKSNSILDMIAMNSTNYINNIPTKELFRDAQQFALNNLSYGEDILLVTPINNKKILQSLGYAGHDIMIIDNDYKDMTMYGYPNGNALEYRINSLLPINIDDDLFPDGLPWDIKTPSILIQKIITKMGF